MARRADREQGAGDGGDREAPDRWAADRRWMVDHDLAGRGIVDGAVLAAMAEVPRERFVPSALADEAYGDFPLPIGEGQTISQPFIVALMLEAAELQPGDRLLEIGTGSGYSAAVARRMGVAVWTIERFEGLADAARERLAALGVDGVEVRCGDGTLGWPGEAPFDAVVVTAGGPSVPPALRDQLADGGRLVIPVGREYGDQDLLRVRRRGEEFVFEDLGGVRFVPLVGEQGWPAAR